MADITINIHKNDHYTYTLFIFRQITPYFFFFCFCHFLLTFFNFKTSQNFCSAAEYVFEIDRKFLKNAGFCILTSILIWQR